MSEDEIPEVEAERAEHAETDLHPPPLIRTAAQAPEIVEGDHLQVVPGESVRQLLADGFEDAGYFTRNLRAIGSACRSGVGAEGPCGQRSLEVLRSRARLLHV
jgi:hypothetical protein